MDLIEILYSKSLTSFDELAEDFKSSCKSWRKSFVPSLPHVNASHSIHVVISQAPQLLVRDHGPNIHSSSGIKHSHQTMNMDIRCYSGWLPWSRTLPVHWLMRTDLRIQCSSPTGRWKWLSCIKNLMQYVSNALQNDSCVLNVNSGTDWHECQISWQLWIL